MASDTPAACNHQPMALLILTCEPSQMTTLETAGCLRQVHPSRICGQVSLRLQAASLVLIARNLTGPNQLIALGSPPAQGILPFLQPADHMEGLIIIKTQTLQHRVAQSLMLQPPQHQGPFPSTRKSTSLEEDHAWTKGHQRPHAVTHGLPPQQASCHTHGRGSRLALIRRLRRVPFSTMGTSNTLHNIPVSLVIPSQT